MPASLSPPSAPDALVLAGAMAARLCHDFAGPLGSLAATLGLLDEEGDAEALALARESAQVLAARLRLVRAAWAGGDDVLDDAAMLALAAGLPGAERLRVRVALAAGVPAEHRRLGLCLLLLAAAALPRGGTVTLASRELSVALAVEGAGAGWPACLAACAREPGEAWARAGDARSLAAPMACLLAQAEGMRLVLVSTTELLLAAA